MLQPGDVLAECNQVIIPGGRSFGLRDDLANVFPGRFTHYKPAAVALQTTLELFEGMPSRLHLTPHRSVMICRRSGRRPAACCWPIAAISNGII
ncbi:MAG: hypothetical protein PF501_15135 [Salinisphaera sp.]|jgi:hypothetical protein|nr:hypothetical protein [Salinisphaera sp.]